MPSLVGLVGKRLLDGLDGDRNVLEVERASFLARRRADAAGEFREIVGRVEVADRIVPVAIVDEVVPVRDLVVDRAAGRSMAIGHAAIHAARRLLLDLLVRHRQRELAEMPDAVRRRLVLVHLPVDLEKACYLAHSIKSNCLGTALGPQPILNLETRDARQGAVVSPSISQSAEAQVTPPQPRRACAPSRSARGGTRPASPS